MDDPLFKSWRKLQFDSLFLPHLPQQVWIEWSEESRLWPKESTHLVGEHFQALVRRSPQKEIHSQELQAISKGGTPGRNCIFLEAFNFLVECMETLHWRARCKKHSTKTRSSGNVWTLPQNNSFLSCCPCIMKQYLYKNPNPKRISDKTGFLELQLHCKHQDENKSTIHEIYIPSTKTPPQSTSPAALEALLQRIPSSHLCLSTPQPRCLCKGVKYF